MAFSVLDGKPQFCHSLIGDNPVEEVNIGLGDMARLPSLMRQFFRAEDVEDDEILDLLAELGNTPNEAGAPLRELEWVYVLLYSEHEGRILQEKSADGSRSLTTRQVHGALQRYRRGATESEDQLLAASLIRVMRNLCERNGSLLLKPLEELRAAEGAV